MSRFPVRNFVYLALAGALACGDNIAPQFAADASRPDAPMSDIDAMMPDAMPPDAPVVTDGIQDALDTPDGTASVAINDVWVTYTKPTVGNDMAGFFVQAVQTGPALFVAVDPAILTPVPAVGDQVSFTVDMMGTVPGLRQATMISGLSVSMSGGDVSALAQDVTDAADLVTSLDSYTAELVMGTFTFTSGFGGAGSMHSKADVDTAVIVANPDLALRMPSTMATDLTATHGSLVGCSVTTTPTPLWRFNAEAQVHVWQASELTNLTCAAPVVTGAVATSDTTVRVSFSRMIDAASITDAAAQFTIDNGLTVSGAAVSGSDVTLTTGMQTSGTTYTVMVAASVTDSLGSGVDPAANSATFDGFVVVPPPDIVINEIDYDQPGTDMTEFIELYNRGANPASLANLAVVLVNGSPTSLSEYLRIDLSGGGTLGAGEYLVIANAGVVVPGGVTTIPINNNVIQNGAPDGLALIDTVSQTVLDALSYEDPMGALTAVTITGFPGPVNLVEGTPAAVIDDGTAAEASLVRLPNGADSNDAATDWALATTVTPGAAN